MPEKYLPIGSIVKVKGLNKKMMIAGYYSLEYKNSVKIYDYAGYVYPEGLLVKNNSFSFNHSDITNVEFMGYMDEAYKTLNQNLLGQLEMPSKNMNKPSSFINLKFDENRVVIYDEISPEDKKPEIIKTITNPFEIKAKDTSKAKKPVVNSQFAFDESGVVVEDQTTKENKADIERNFKYTFDENGIITSEVAVDIPQTNDTELNNSKTIYKFDENGIVIGVKGSNESQYNVDSKNIAEDSMPDESLDDGIKIPHYTFDENGIIIN